MTTTEQLTTTRRTERGAIGVAALAGLGWFVAGLGSTTPDAPEPGTASVAEIRSYVADSTGTLSVNTISAILGVISLIVLAAALGRIIEHHREGSVLPAVVLAGAVIASLQGIFLVAVDGVWLLLDEDVSKLGDESVRTLFDLGAVSHGITSVVLPIGCVLVVGGASWAALRDRFLARPVAALGLMIAVAGAVAALEIVIDSSVMAGPFFFALFGWFLWPAVVAVNLGVRWVRTR
jgi:hypothetical protein